MKVIVRRGRDVAFVESLELKNFWPSGFLDSSSTCRSSRPWFGFGPDHHASTAVVTFHAYHPGTSLTPEMASTAPGSKSPPPVPLRVEFHSFTPSSRSHDEPNSVQGLVIRYTPIVMASFVAAAFM